MAENIKVPGVFSPGVGDHIGYAQHIKDNNLKDKTQSYLNSLFNQGKGIDPNGNEVTIGNYSAGEGISLVGNVFSLDETSKAKLNSVAVGVKSENHRGNWVKQKLSYEPLLSVYTDTTCKQRPVVGQSYNRLYVKLNASEIVGNQTWKHTSNCDAGIRFWEDPIDGTMFEVTLYIDFTNQWDNFVGNAVLILDAPSPIEFKSDMCTNFYANGAYNNTGGSIVNENYNPYKNTSATFITVYHDNAKWLCNGDVNEVVDDIPSDASSKWVKLQAAVENKGVSYIVTEYALSTSASSVTGQWTQAIKTISNIDKYLWERTTFFYTDGTTYIVPAHVVGAYGDPGANGTSITIKGTIGPDENLPASGNSVGDCYVVEGYLWVWTASERWINSGKLKGDDATQYYIHTAHADSNVYQDESHWTTGVPQRDYAYIGICVNTTEADPSGAEGFAMYEWSLSSTIVYSIVPDKNILVEGETGTTLRLIRSIGSNIKRYTTGSEITGEYINFQPAGSRDCQLAYSEAAGFALNVPNGVIYGNDYTVKAVKNGVEIARVTIGVVKAGAKGSRGAKLRGPSEWKPGISYMGGAENEEFQDLVLYENKMYLCKFTHTSQSNALPKDHVAVSGWNSSRPWQESAIQDMVATKVLFAERGKIENLDIENATITGTITSDTLYVPGTNDNQTVVVDASNMRSLTLADMTNRMVILPMYEDFEDYPSGFNVPGYKVAGTTIKISTEPNFDTSNWASFDIENWDEKPGQVSTLFDHSVLVCADPYTLTAITAGSVKTPRHEWHGQSLIANGSTYKHGRFSARGIVSRFILLPPGQSLSLTSTIQKIDCGDGEAAECLVWNVDNASDFVSVNMLVKDEYASGYSNDFYYNANGMHPLGDGYSDTWREMFLSYKGMDFSVYNKSAGEREAQKNGSIKPCIIYASKSGSTPKLPSWMPLKSNTRFQ